MIATIICNSFKRELLDGIHAAGDVYKIALYTNAATLDKSTTAYSTTNEVVGTGYFAGGMALSGRSVVLDGDSAILDFDNPTWSGATITARGCLIYNATKANRAVAVYDFGASVSSTNAPFVVMLPEPTAATALAVIA